MAIHSLRGFWQVLSLFHGERNTAYLFEESTEIPVLVHPCRGPASAGGWCWGAALGENAGETAAMQASGVI